MRVSISFDYDSPIGYRKSFSHASLHAAADFEGTHALLQTLAEHEVKSTFAVVGNVALDGAIPEHCPDQIRAIRDAGHEIASHSMYHGFIPVMRRSELLSDLSASKQALETCAGQTVRGFVPPSIALRTSRKRAASASRSWRACTAGGAGVRAQANFSMLWGLRVSAGAA